jgi:hypothetical protein
MSHRDRRQFPYLDMRRTILDWKTVRNPPECQKAAVKCDRRNFSQSSLHLWLSLNRILCLSTSPSTLTSVFQYIKSTPRMIERRIETELFQFKFEDLAIGTLPKAETTNRMYHGIPQGGQSCNVPELSKKMLASYGTRDVS